MRSFSANLDNPFIAGNNGEFFPYNQPRLVTITQAVYEEYEGQEKIILTLSTQNNEHSVVVYLDLIKKNGAENTHNVNLMNSLLALTNTPHTTPSPAMIEYYDTNLRQKSQKQGMVFADLHGKQVGVIVQKSYYFSPKHNEIRINNSIYALFNKNNQTPTMVKENQQGSSEELLVLAESCQKASDNSLQVAEREKERLAQAQGFQPNNQPNQNFNDYEYGNYNYGNPPPPPEYDEPFPFNHQPRYR